MEQWRLIHEYQGNSKTHLKGDKYYISNKGRVKLNDIILDFGTGLYVTSGKELRIYGCPMKDKFHRIVYQLFKGEVIRDVHYNIHHIDGNHINNDVSNLIQVHAIEHGKLHKEMQDNGLYDQMLKYNAIIEEKYKNVKKYREQAKQFLLDYTLNRLNIIKYKKEQDKLELYKQKQIQQQKDKEEYIKKRLEQGYKFNKNGVLYDPECINKMQLARTKETYDKIQKSCKEYLDNHPEYRKKLSDNVKCRVHINNGNTSKFVKPDILEEYINKGWKIGTLPRRIRIIKGNKTKKIYPNELDDYVALGWEKKKRTWKVNK